MRAIVSIVIEGVLAVHGLRIVHKNGRLCVKMPHMRDDRGKLCDAIRLLSDELQEKFEREILDCYVAHRNYKALLLNNVMSLQTQYKDEAIPFDDVVAVTSENHRAPQNLLRTALLKLILEEYVIPVERKMEYQRVSCIKVDWDAVSKDGLLLLE